MEANRKQRDVFAKNMEGKAIHMEEKAKHMEEKAKHMEEKAIHMEEKAILLDVNPKQRDVFPIFLEEKAKLKDVNRFYMEEKAKHMDVNRKLKDVDARQNPVSRDVLQQVGVRWWKNGVRQVLARPITVAPSNTPEIQSSINAPPRFCVGSGWPCKCLLKNHERI